MAEVELHGVVVGPLEAVHAEIRAEQPVGGGQAVLVGHGEHQQDRVDQEDQLPAGAEQPRRLGDPGVRVAPDAGAVLADRQVEAGVGERRPLGVGLEQREPQPETLLQAVRGRQLGRGVVQGHRPSAAARQPGRDVAGTAAELDAVEAAGIGRQHAGLGLGDAPDAPGRLGRRPVPQACGFVTGRPLIPRGTVAQHMISGLGHTGQHRLRAGPPSTGYRPYRVGAGVGGLWQRVADGVGVQLEAWEAGDT